jgi:ABC-type dipeptide/oligopeptide/nickel transport system permease component
MLRYLFRRLAWLPLQILGLITLVFFLTRLIPGDPAFALAGGQATEEQVASIRRTLGLDQNLLVQYQRYLAGLLRGDWGTSIQTGAPVTQDILQRAPATLLLMGVSLLFIVLLALLLTGIVLAWPRGPLRKVLDGYGFLAGVVPDFWVGLALVSLLYVQLHVGASPIGQLDSRIFVDPITGVGLFDAMLAGDTTAVLNAISHLFLPCLTLVFVYLAPVMRIMSAVSHAASSADFARFADSWGISPLRRVRYVIRYTSPTLVTTLASTTVFLVGGAVLVETVFSWGGLGQYAVGAVTKSDYVGVQGFVLVAGVFTALVYLAGDALHAIIDPQVRTS